MSKELLRRVVVVIVVAIEMVASVRSRLACFVCSGNECQAPSEFFLDCIVGICRKLK